MAFTDSKTDDNAKAYANVVIYNATLHYYEIFHLYLFACCEENMHNK